MKFSEWLEVAPLRDLVDIATPKIDAAEQAHWKLCQMHRTRRGKKTTPELALSDYYETWGESNER